MRLDEGGKRPSSSSQLVFLPVLTVSVYKGASEYLFAMVKDDLEHVISVKILCRSQLAPDPTIRVPLLKACMYS